MIKKIKMAQEVDQLWSNCFLSRSWTCLKFLKLFIRKESWWKSQLVLICLNEKNKYTCTINTCGLSLATFPCGQWSGTLHSRAPAWWGGLLWRPVALSHCQKTSPQSGAGGWWAAEPSREYKCTLQHLWHQRPRLCWRISWYVCE